MPTVFTPFTKYNLARNFAFCKISSPNYILVAEQLSQVTININQVPTGQFAQFYLEFNGHVLQMFITNYTTNSLTEIPNASNYTGSLDFYRLLFIGKLSQQPDYPYFFEKFMINFDPVSGIILIKAYETDVSLSLFNSMNANSNGITLTNINLVGTPAIYEEGFKYVVKTYGEITNFAYNFKLLGVDNVYPSKDSTAIIDVAEYLKTIHLKEPPSYSSTTLTILTQLFKRFNVSIFEFYNNESHPKNSIIFQFENSVFAGVNHQNYVNRLSQGNSLQFDWLTNQPALEFSLLQNQIQYLTLIAEGSFNVPKLFRLKTSVTLQNNTVIDIYTDNVSVNRITPIRFGISLQKIAIAAAVPLNEILHLSIKLVENITDVIFSETVFFKVDNRKSEFHKTFIYQNEKGGYQSIIALGHNSTEFEMDFKVGEVYLSPLHNAIDGSYTKLHSSSLETIKAEIGYDSFSNNLVAQEFLDSLDVYEFALGELLPIIIQNKKSKPGESQEIIGSLEFEYHYAFDKSMN
jgi:hypothetical protein